MLSLIVGDYSWPENGKAAKAHLFDVLNDIGHAIRFPEWI